MDAARYDNHQIASLRTQHAVLESLLAEEQRRPRPNDAEVRLAKARKLWIKDQLERLNAAAR